MKYRPEIDGLRAFAVVPVILFHAGFDLFSGGFVGVDVFFVISGYLITGILVDDIENDRFSIVGFYERRARRILPALFFIMFVCIPFAWMWMLPDQLKDFSQSLIAVSLFASNVLFWQENGYFAAAAEEKPMLHTWSLAVEEQYYVLFPIFLFLTWRFGKNRVFWMIVFFATVSLALSEWGWRNKESANFYLAPTRAWELLAGSIAAFTVQKQGVQENNALSLVGLILIVLSVFVYSERTPFPSLYAMAPVCGVVLLVLFGGKETLVAKFLGTKFFVAIGLLSYSAYLWHQPLIAFARIYTFNQIAFPLAVFIVFSTFAISYLSWKFVESPFRKRGNFGRNTILSFSMIGVVFFVFIGFIGQKELGFIERFGAETVSLSRAIEDWEHPGALEKSVIDGLYVFDSAKPIDVLFFGDSHAEQYAPLSKYLFEAGRVNVGFLTGGGCPPIPNLFDHLHQHCVDLFERLDILLQENESIETVVISGCFNCYFIEQSKKFANGVKSDYYYQDRNDKLYFRKGNGHEEALRSLGQFADKLSIDKKVVVIADNPGGSSFDPKVMSAYIERGESYYFSLKYPSFSFEPFVLQEEIFNLNNRILNLFETDISVVNSLAVVCESTKCSGLDESGNSKYKDSNHMRPEFVLEKYSKLIAGALKI